MRSALFAAGRLVVGQTHADCYSLLTDEERTGDFHYGWVDETSRRFVAGDYQFYLKHLLLVRHALTTDGPDGIHILSSEHRHLAEVAASTADIFDMTSFCCFTSPVTRCVETAHELCLAWSKVPIVAEPLRPQDGDETAAEFRRRLCCFVDAAPDWSVLVCHDDVIRCMLRAVIPGGTEPPCIPNCSVTYIDQDRPVFVAEDICNLTGKELAC